MNGYFSCEMSTEKVCFPGRIKVNRKILDFNCRLFFLWTDLLLSLSLMVLILWLLHKVPCQNISTKGWLLLIQTHVLLQKKKTIKNAFSCFHTPPSLKLHFQTMNLLSIPWFKEILFIVLSDNWNNLEVFIIKEHALFSNSAYQISLFYFKSAFKARLFD